MEISVKNIILYDKQQNVSGFAEVKVRYGMTDIKVRHNFDEKGLLCSITADGETSHVFALDAAQTQASIHGKLDISREIFVCIIKRVNSELITLANGVINPDRKNIIKRTQSTKDLRQQLEGQTEKSDETFIAKPVEVGSVKENFDNINTTIAIEKESEPQSVLASVEFAKTKEAKEVDEILRAVCTIDENGKGYCETCPYREHFFETNGEVAFGRDSRQSARGITNQAAATASVFFDIVKGQIESILESNLPVEFLNTAVQGGRFVRVNSDADGHAVGIIYDESGEAQYVCSAQFSSAKQDIPVELEGYAQWLPKDFENPEGEGYWLSYQEAATGTVLAIANEK